MITDVFLNWAHSLLLKILGIFQTAFPTNPVPQAAHDATTALGGYLNAFSPIVPLDTLWTAASIIILVEVILFSFRFARWVLSHIPLIGGLFR